VNNFLYGRLYPGEYQESWGWVLCLIVILTVYHISDAFSIYTSGSHGILGRALSNKSPFHKSLLLFCTLDYSIAQNNFTDSPPQSPIMPYANLLYVEGPAAILRFLGRGRTAFRHPVRSRTLAVASAQLGP